MWDAVGKGVWGWTVRGGAELLCRWCGLTAGFELGGETRMGCAERAGRRDDSASGRPLQAGTWRNAGFCGGVAMAGLFLESVAGVEECVARRELWMRLTWPLRLKTGM